MLARVALKIRNGQTTPNYTTYPVLPTGLVPRQHVCSPHFFLGSLRQSVVDAKTVTPQDRVYFVSAFVAAHIFGIMVQKRRLGEPLLKLRIIYGDFNPALEYKDGFAVRFKQHQAQGS